MCRATIDKPIPGRLDKLTLEDTLARAKVRLGQALLGADRRNEALVTLGEAVAHYRAEQGKGAGGTIFRQDFARALYQLAQAQPPDEAGRAQRRTLLDEAAGQLGGLSLEAQQLLTSKELVQWVAAARRQLGD